MTNKKQMTVVCHVDYLEVSHADSFEITKFSGYMASIYVGLTVNKGKLNDYLGMDLEYSKEVTVKLSMIKYLDIVQQEFPENLITNASTSGADYLLEVHNEG